MREVLIHGERFILHPERVLIWPEQELLVAADLHLGKNETFLFGNLNDTPQDQWRELMALEDVMDEFPVKRIMFLGDFLHSPHGLTEKIVQDLSDFLLRTDQDVTLIPSNRDRGALKLLNAYFPKMEVLYQWQIDKFIFQHQPPPRTDVSAPEFFWCGHLNPTAQGLPCFVVDSDVGVLPAYSKIEGGNAVSDQPGRRVFLCDGKSIEEV